MPNVNFRELMETTSETVERPKSAPECWLIAVIGQSIADVTKGINETPFLMFDLTNVEPHPQNPTEINSMLEVEDRRGVPLYKRLRSPYRRGLTAEFWLTPEAQYRLTDRLDAVVGGRNRSIRERVAEMTNQRVQFKVRPHRDEQGNDTGQNIVLSDTISPATA